MRPLNGFARLTRKRAAYRRFYDVYMNSPGWQQRRRDWLTEHYRRTGETPVCAGCLKPWTPTDDLHHRSYARLGHEAFDDLVPLCRRPCHERLHEALDHSPSWRRMSHARASDLLLARMRKEARRDTRRPATRRAEREPAQHRPIRLHR